MKTKKMKIEYRKQTDSETAPWQLLTNVDELLWNGVYALRVTDDDGSHNLPFRLANDDTVTFVVKDHAHDGMLENARTVVQTVTRVDRATGNVLVYNRTRYNAGGTHSWSYWTVAGEGTATVEIPTASTTSAGAVIVGDGLAVDADGKVSLAAGSVGKQQLTAEVGAQIDSMAEKLQFSASFAVNDGIAMHVGALVENTTPYSGTNFRAYTGKILSNGELLVVNEGYLISTYKVFDGEQEIAFVNNLSMKHFSLNGEHLNYQLEFKKSDTTAFADSELPTVIKYFQRNPIAWSAASHINNFIAPGTYNIHGDRANLSDGLPIYNTGSFSARLTVLASNNCVTQLLTLLNVGGGDCNVYTRTRQGGNWGTWSKLQQNVEVGETTSLDAYIDNGIYSGVYTNGTTHFETFVMVVINNYAVAAATGTVRSITQLKYAVDTNGTFCYHARTGQGADTVEWGEWNDLDSVITTNRIQDGAVTAQKLSIDVREKVEKVAKLEENVAKEKTALVNGDTVVGLTREVYSRQGKVDAATFLKRTTAGGTSVSDGVASVRQIGGNIVKNLLGNFNSIVNCFKYNIQFKNDSVIINAKEEYIGNTAGSSHIGISTLNFITGHTYYVSANCYSEVDRAVYICPAADGYNRTTKFADIRANEWQYVSRILTVTGDDLTPHLSIYPFGVSGDILIQEGELVLYGGINIIDLTEMFGIGKEPSLADCDKLFATMAPLSQGLTVAQPVGLRSIGYNQWNPANLFTAKTITDNAIVDGDKSVAFIECLPCKIGAGENNGYVIGYGEGDDWSDAGIEVYLTPIYPMTGDGLLYAHKLEKDTTTGTYVPTINGYLLVVTPVTDKLCVHLLWSGDRAKTDYEEYIESAVSLPAIPQMSEWGLAGIAASGVRDTIDLENNKFTKRVGCVDLGTLQWLDMSLKGTRFRTTDLDMTRVANKIQLVCDKYTVLPTVYGKETYTNNTALKDVIFPVSFDNDINIMTSVEYASVADFKAAVSGVKLYYELSAYEEYPITAKAAPNYVGCDYGVEQWTGSKVPLVANILFYMRSLVSETRNFLDRLMAGLGTSDATAVADRIVAAIMPQEEPEELLPTESE